MRPGRHARLSSTSMLSALALGVASPALVSPALGSAQFQPPGVLQAPDHEGYRGEENTVPDLVFPVLGCAYLNSQRYGRGGPLGDGGDECDVENFSLPWWDTYCEPGASSGVTRFCPQGGVGSIKIRGADCRADVHEVVAVVDGRVTSLGSYSVYLTDSTGRRFDYFHLASVSVTQGQSVTAGQVIGRVSDRFGGAETTVHLSFSIKLNAGGMSEFWPSYVALREAYLRRGDLEGTCGFPSTSAPDAGTGTELTDADTPPPLPPVRPDAAIAPSERLDAHIDGADDVGVSPDRERWEHRSCAAAPPRRHHAASFLGVVGVALLGRRRRR